MVGSIKVGAKAVFKEAVEKGLSRSAALKAATTYVVVQVTSAAASTAAASVAVPTVLSYAGLDETEVQIGLAAFAAVGVVSTLATRPIARRAAARAGRSKKRRKKTTDGSKDPARPRQDEDVLWDETHPLIEGVPDKHRTPYHKFLQQTMADEMQASGYYKRVGMGRPLSEFSGLKHSPDIRPDNIGLTPDGRIDLVEILSPSQTKDELEQKLLKALNQLPREKRGDVRVTDPQDAFK
jgi:hypothetical protein